MSDTLKKWKVNIFKVHVIDKRIKFYSQNTNLLPPKPKSTFRHMKLDIQELHMKYVLVPSEKAANNVNTLKQEMSGTKANEEISEDEKSIIFRHCTDVALKFSVNVKEQQDKLRMMYWLPKLHKRPYKGRHFANSSVCTTTKLSKLLTSCLTAITIHVRYCEKLYERSGKSFVLVNSSFF